ncbi:hypothetical protein KM043_013628 [Ampulex compressa]|nr:hypothetical protein KM043_013628 [Ampulex compressa]
MGDRLRAFHHGAGDGLSTRGDGGRRVRGVGTTGPHGGRRMTLRNRGKWCTGNEALEKRGGVGSAVNVTVDSASNYSLYPHDDLFFLPLLARRAETRRRGYPGRRGITTVVGGGCDCEATRGSTVAADV